MTIAIALTSVFVFLLAFEFFKVIPISRKAITTAGLAAATMRDKEISENEREKSVQKASLKLFGHFFSIFIRVGAALFASLIPIFAADFFGVSAAHLAIDWLSRLDVIAIISVVMITFWWAKGKFWTST